MRSSPNIHHIPLILVLLVWQIGCSPWNLQESSGVPRLPIPNMPHDSIGVEVATVTVDVEQAEVLADIFSRLDEQVIDVDTRRFLALNGFRAGVLGVQVPESLKLLLMEASDRRKHPTAETQHYRDIQRYVQFRSSGKENVELWGTYSQLVVNYDNGEFSSDVQLSEASCMMRLSGTPLGSSGATIRLAPEIQHGPMRQKYVAQDNAFHMEAQRDQLQYEDLTCELQLRPGEILMVTCDPQSDSLAKSFFVNPIQRSQKLLLVRLAQTHVENFFENDEG